MGYEKFNKIVGLVVWYNPTEKEVTTMKLYHPHVEHVIVVDNSTADNRALLAGLEHVTYLSSGENRGIAAALNTGCKEAQKLGAEWVLTMDQDSQWSQQTVQEYIAEAAQYEEFDKVGIFSPFHDCDGTPERHKKYGRFQEMQIIMCSGNLLRLKAWEEAGGFKENFFIDCVDDEISCHLRQLGWRIIRTNRILLTHHLGNGIQIVKLIHHPYTAHPAWRYYYRGRNMLWMAQLYPEMAKYYRGHALKEMKRLWLYDWQDDKWDKLKQYRRGLREGLRKYPYPCN